MIRQVRPCRRWTVLGLTCVLLAVPLFVTGGHRVRGLPLRVPGVQAGDEPHYLVMISSLLHDGDLDLANNYQSAHAGSWQAGRRFAGKPLDHHTVWFVDGVRTFWRDVFEADDDRWERDAGGNPRPRQREGVTVDVSRRPEYSMHPTGLALLLAPILAVFRETRAIEPLTLFCSLGATLLTLLAFRALLRRFDANPTEADVVTLATFLGTPVWHYARSLFAEPYLMACLVGAYAVVLRSRAYVVAGCLVAVGMVMKPPFALVLVPLAIAAAWRKEVGGLAGLTLPPLAATTLILGLNQTMFGSPWQSSQAFVAGNPLQGTLGLLFGGRHGLVACAPIALVALMGWPRLLKDRPWPAGLVGSAFVVYFVFMALRATWMGGHSYGPRLIVPILPILMLGLLGFLRSELGAVGGVRVAAWGLGLVSIVFNAWAALDYPAAFGSHPLLHLLKALGLGS